MFSGNGRAFNRLVVGGGTDTGSGGRMPHSRSWRGVSMRVRLFAGLGLAVALLATLVALLAPPLQAQTTTEVEVPNDWGLIPSGLATGDQFRLVFYSSTKTDATSTDIEDYNTFIKNLAAAGHADLADYSAGFRVVGCTAAVDARDNTATNTNTDGAGVPIYWVNGSKVADDNADFYDGDWDDEANDKDESGNNGPDTSVGANRPFTGCEHNGTEAATSGGFSSALGTSQVHVGRPNSSLTTSGPLSSNNTADKNLLRPMYGLSQVFEVAAPGPPPEVTVPNDWGLIPSGLATGDQFRLVFYSSTKTDATSTDIEDYNTFIKNLAAAGHADLADYSAGFRVVGCTAAVDARDNTATNTNTDGAGVPIYWVNGSKVADDYADFYDGSWDDEANDKNESGNNGPDTSLDDNDPWTGCEHNGTEAFSGGGSTSNALGANGVRIGVLNDSTTNYGPLNKEFIGGNIQNRLMYGLSQVFKVLASPETTLSALVLEDAINGSAITLDPGFAPDHFEYAASVGFPVSQLTVIPTKNDAGASIKYLSELDGELDDVLNDANTSQTGFQVNLAEGAPHFIKVEVTSSDGTTTATYTLTVTRAVGPGQVLLSEKLLSLTEGEMDSNSYSLVLNRQPAANVTVTIGGHAETGVDVTPTTHVFNTSSWHMPVDVFVEADADANSTNESVTLTHTATSSDSFFDGITIPSVIVNVDDQDAPDHHIRTITLPPGEKPLPEEEIYPLVHLPPAMPTESGIEFLIIDPSKQVFEHINVVAEGHIWRPSGLWGEPDTDTMWVVDPSHLGIHPLKLSALKQGLIERRVAADASEFDQRLNYNCHFSEGRASGNGNPSLTVMWGSASQLWIANNSSGTLDAYDRDSSITDQCYTRNVTSWAADGQSYETADEDFKSPFGFFAWLDLSGGPLTVRGIWASSTKVWLSGPTGGVYTSPPVADRGMYFILRLTQLIVRPDSR